MKWQSRAPQMPINHRIMTKLIADCGSSKCDWALVLESGETVYFETSGKNALLTEAAELRYWLTASLEKHVDTMPIRKVYFYGAGCLSEGIQKKVADAFHSQVFEVDEVTVDSDIMGAVYAHHPPGPAYIGILGTGANMVYYDGAQIDRLCPSLGYILGDEGSGADLGKALIKKMLRGAFSQKLEHHFFQWIGKSSNDIITTLYQHPAPNQYLAKLTPFIYKNIHEPSLKKLVMSRLNKYVRYHLLPGRKRGVNRVYFVGGVAHAFHNQLKQVLEEYDFTLSGVLPKPIQGLVSYLR